MDFGAMLDGLLSALTLQNLGFALLGALLGSIVGVLPGLGPLLTMAILLPLTYGMDPTGALIMLAGIYYGAMYGGSTTSIMLNLPGENASVVTALDGYQLRLQGRAGPALGMAAVSSFIAGVFAVLVLAFLAGPITAASRFMGPPETLLLIVMALSLVGVLGSSSPMKGLIMAAFGLLLAVVGTDIFTGVPRLTMGIPQLISGIDMVPVIIGLFALGEVFYGLPSVSGNVSARKPKMRDLIPTRDDFKKSALPIARSSVVGSGLGIVPGVGPTISSYVTYGIEKSLAKEPARFGKGAIEGVAAPEAANNAAATGAMIPLLTLGIPGSAAAAVLLQAFIVHGIQPGPSLFADHPLVAWGLIGSMLIANLMLLAINLPLVGMFLQLLRLPYPFLGLLTIFLSILGCYSISHRFTDVWVMFIAGIVGWIARRYNYPLAPMALAVVLGDLLETSFRQTLLVSDDGVLAVLQRPGSLSLIAVFALIAVYLVVRKFVNGRRAKSSFVDPDHAGRREDRRG